MNNMSNEASSTSDQTVVQVVNKPSGLSNLFRREIEGQQYIFYPDFPLYTSNPAYRPTSCFNFDIFATVVHIHTVFLCSNSNMSDCLTSLTPLDIFSTMLPLSKIPAISLVNTMLQPIYQWWYCDHVVINHGFPLSSNLMPCEKDKFN